MPHVLAARDGLCPNPFLQASDYPATGGYIQGRFCAPVPTPKGNVTCCLPCPQTDWIYPDNFFLLTRIANYVTAVGLACSLFLLASFTFLPVKATHRHYLGVSLVVGIILMQMGFIIPLGSRPKQCYNNITPNDMRSDISCALSGACLLAGGWCGVLWVFLRALSLHLQICWEVVPGKKFFYGAQIAGWGIPSIASAVAIAITGVSYRFGDTCHINHTHALADFWGPLLGVAGLAIIIQFATFGYCLQVYLRAMMDDKPTTQGSSSLPSYSSSVRTVPSARQAYRRVRKVLSLQWRGIFVVILIVADVIFFSIVFVFMDNAAQSAKNNPDSAKPWLLCLVVHKGDKNKCLDRTKDLILPERTIIAVLLLLSTNGIWLLVALGRWSMVTGWIELIKGRFQRKTNFVSIDARRESTDPRTYEMLSSPQSGIKSPDPLITSASPPAGYTPNLKETGGTDYFDRHTSKYNSPHLSFSSPRAPQRFSPGDSKIAGNQKFSPDMAMGNRI